MGDKKNQVLNDYCNSQECGGGKKSFIKIFWVLQKQQQHKVTLLKHYSYFQKWSPHHLILLSQSLTMKPPTIHISPYYQKYLRGGNSSALKENKTQKLNETHETLVVAVVLCHASWWCVDENGNFHVTFPPFPPALRPYNLNLTSVILSLRSIVGAGEESKV